MLQRHGNIRKQNQVPRSDTYLKQIISIGETLDTQKHQISNKINRKCYNFPINSSRELSWSPVKNLKSCILSELNPIHSCVPVYECRRVQNEAKHKRTEINLIELKLFEVSISSG